MADSDLANEFFYGELRGDEVHRLSQPYWNQVQPTGEILPLANLQIDVPVAPSKLIAVGLNYADHIAEMKRTEIGAPLIWFKAPSSLLAHQGVIEIAFPKHQTDFETELAVVIGSRTKNVSADDALDHVFGYTIGLDITDRDLQKQEKQFGRCKSFDSYTPIGPFVYADADVRDVLAKVVAERRAAPEHAHEPNDPFSRADYFIRQSIAHTFAGRCDSNWNTSWRGPDSSGRRIGSRDRLIGRACATRSRSRKRFRTDSR